MSTNPTYRQLSHAAAKTSNKAQKVYWCVMEHGDMTRNRIAEITGLKIQSVCGRVGELKEVGLVFIEEAKGGQKVCAAKTEADRESLAYLYERNQEKKAFATMVKCFTTLKKRFTQREITHLAEMVRRLNTEI